MATIAMEQMVSDLTEKVLEVRKSKRGDEGDEEQVLSGILGPLNNTLHQEDIVETRDLLKRAEKEIVRLLGIETSKLSIEVNTLQSKATERKRVLHDLKVEYANRESQMKLVMGSLGVIGKKFREVGCHMAHFARFLVELARIACSLPIVFFKSVSSNTNTHPSTVLASCSEGS